ncbi:uncharacterized protein EV154DRAFT_521021 [Mucor mucedo]|uniref:uncharacterized protein n=1 Tax=Mucor mucedo TaxID=29922 RepID=UPI00221E5B06|nr:uncharacterized protein EV154DRAFT_521021 [Mucor mucedo]KAI7886865.1 hypothetical protein EV154DRAFT_521021 [Mucor mucedo]
MSPHEFTATINTFNTAAWHYPPPSRIGTGSLNYYLFCLSTIVLVAVITAIHYTHQIGLILVLPFSFLLFSLIVIYWRRRKMNRFESAMIHLCSCMNATENVRGINFRLTYLTPEQQISIHPSSSYAITIEFDDRYNLLHHFSSSNRQQQPPAYNSTSITISPPLYEIDKPSNIYQSSLKN